MQGDRWEQRARGRGGREQHEERGRDGPTELEMEALLCRAVLTEECIMAFFISYLNNAYYVFILFAPSIQEIVRNGFKNLKRPRFEIVSEIPITLVVSGPNAITCYRKII